MLVDISYISGSYIDTLTDAAGRELRFGYTGSALTSLTLNGTLADLNPFRYRSYYYDEETYFYYLQSRYYDPAIGRFINADAFYYTGQGVLGYNMFAYCGNDPVVFSDPFGYRHDAGGASAHFDPEAFQEYITPIIENVRNRIRYAEEYSCLEGGIISSYRNKLVLRPEFMKNAGFSSGFILIGSDISSNLAGVELLRHEYGHTRQYENMGILPYTAFVVIPSVTCFALNNTGKLEYDYYSLPWEYGADLYGGVRRNYAPKSDQLYYVFMTIVTYLTSGESIMEYACKLDS